MTSVTSQNQLSTTSTAIVLAGQAESGAYIASPSFSQYRLGWLRDGSYCALAMQSVGQDESAWQFHRWVAAVVDAQQGRLRRILGRLATGRAISQQMMMPTRYRLDGTAEKACAWPSYQLDGYGTWLFALYSAFRKDPSRMSVGIEQSARAVANYVSAAWQLPCFDYWEESADQVHTSTLAALAAGLRAGARLFDDAQLDSQADAVIAFMGSNCVHSGAFVKSTTDDRVDGSLLSLAVPFGLISRDDARFESTLQRIRCELTSPSGGIRRYVGDSYYGGGPWVLLTAWLGWCDRLLGDWDGYERACDWVCRQTSPDGTLPEQVISEPQFPEMIEVWQKRWGPVADPLLWSHAKYLLMLHGLEPESWN